MATEGSLAEVYEIIAAVERDNWLFGAQFYDFGFINGEGI